MERVERTASEREEKIDEDKSYKLPKSIKCPNLQTFKR